LLEVLTPSHCVECGSRIPPSSMQSAFSLALCAVCDLSLPWWRRVDGCPRCGSRLSPAAIFVAGERDPFSGTGDACPGCLSRGSALHRCHSLLRYRGAIVRWLPAFKNPSGPFGPSVEVARAIHYLADELGGRIQREGTNALDLIVSVPLHPRRRLRRGFNHADLIARQIANRIGLEWSVDTLIRRRATRPQASLSGRQRLENVRGAFRATRSLDRNCRIGLVDDVLTTGNTLEAAAEALLEAGALEVRGITLAATLPHRRAREAARA
jgi:ComF family protein